jgi:hypothetical protein
MKSSINSSNIVSRKPDSSLFCSSRVAPNFNHSSSRRITSTPSKAFNLLIASSVNGLIGNPRLVLVVYYRTARRGASLRGVIKWRVAWLCDKLVGSGILVGDPMLSLSNLLVKCPRENQPKDHFIMLFETLRGKTNDGLLFESY